jgi:hypothetical protein
MIVTVNAFFLESSEEELFDFRDNPRTNLKIQTYVHPENIAGHL